MSYAAGRCAVVTGGAQGLGRATVARLLAGGLHVVAADIQAEKLETLHAEFGVGNRLQTVAADVSTVQGASAAIERSVSRFERISILVNIAGGSGPISVHDVDDITDEAWNNVLARNIGSTFLCTRAAVPHMRKAGFGRIVNFSSGLAQRGDAGKMGTVGCLLAYCASKGAIEAFSRQLATSVRGTGITVNVIAPGFVITEPGATVRERFEKMSDAGKQSMLRGRSIEEMTKPADIAEAVAFLVSEEAQQISGAIFNVGGR